MSIVVEGLTKLYGQQKAVDDLTFSVNDRQILGFLGPNGAGKSTTMKMLTGYLEPDAGSAIVAGIDMRLDPVAGKRKVGYLPENNPLYLDMYILEYLEWVGQFYDIKQRRKRALEMIALIGLTKERHKKIGQLSKGYRQRVGLAQALIHDPEVIILDEPTSGLDPNQLIEIRGLIKSLGKDKTIILSTHIMQEVAAMCNRVLIIHQGKLVADDPVSVLEQRISGSRQYIVSATNRLEEKAFQKLNELVSVQPDVTGMTYRLTMKGEKDASADIFRLAVEQGWVLTELRTETKGMEEVFQDLTK
jgi:ABC-2 type transport system ATP-binding protein